MPTDILDTLARIRLELDDTKRLVTVDPGHGLESIDPVRAVNSLYWALDGLVDVVQEIAQQITHREP